MNRRSFLTACIATCTAPAIVRASSLMPVRAIEPTLSFYAGWDVHEGEIIRPSFSLDTQLVAIMNNAWLAIAERTGPDILLPIEKDPARVQLSILAKHRIAA